jgi:transcriptional regulator with XRE-family HTH domain
MDMSHVKDERLPQTFRLNLRSRMRAAGINQTQLAALLDVSPSYVSHLLTGHRDPGLTTLSRLADALACRPSDLITEPVDGLQHAPILVSEFSGFSRQHTA